MKGIIGILCSLTFVFTHHTGDGHRHPDLPPGHHHGDGHGHEHVEQGWGSDHDKLPGHHHGDGHTHEHDEQVWGSDHDKLPGHHHGDGHTHGHDAPGHHQGDGHDHHDDTMNVDAKTYLTKFGYLNPFSFGERTVNQSLKLFQQTYGLPKTGVLDKATTKLMATPRCGMQDHSRRGYSDRPWSIKDMTYSFDNYTPDMPKDTVEKVIKQALNYWAKVTPLTFKRVEKNGDIVVSFGEGSHGDSRGHCAFDFDGRNGVLAHAFFPENGRIHFDDAEWFTAHSARGINFLWVATHELGHILGLEHDTQNKEAVMFPYYRRYHPNFNLHANDVKRVRALYGSEKDGSGGTRGSSAGAGCHANCRDVARNCWKYKHYCSGHGGAWTRFLKRKCKKTCGHCC